MIEARNLKRRLLPIFILLVAFALRLVAIDTVPPGLSHDEAYNGVTAIQVIEGQRRIFFEINKGIEPLIIYLEALAFHFFGIGPVQLRLVNVFCGLLTVALVYPLAARLFNHRVALLALAGLAVSFWAIFISRLTLRAVTLPPLLMLTLYFLWRGLNSRVKGQGSRAKSPIPNPSTTLRTGLQYPGGTMSRISHLTSHISNLISRIQNPKSKIQNLKWFTLSGLTAGVTMYTYLSGRFVPVLIAAIFGYQLIRRQINKRHWLGLLILYVTWAILFAPLANYYWQHIDSLTRRSDQVTTIPYVLNGEFGPLVDNTLRTLGMFTFHGDDTDRYNLDGRPVFDWVNGLLFYLGLAIVLLRLRRSSKWAGPSGLLLLWSFFMLLPDFITDDSPHFLRTVGAMPAGYILWSIGLDSASQRIANWRPSTRRLNSHHPSPITHPCPEPCPERSRRGSRRDASRITNYASSLLILVLVTVTTLHSVYDYFGRWAASPGAHYIYGADIAEIAQHLKTAPDQNLAAISAEYYRDLDPFRFRLYFQGRPPFVIWFDGRQSLAFPPAGSGLVPRYFFSASAPPADIWLRFLQPSAAESGREYTVYRLADEASRKQVWDTTFSAENPLNLNVNNDLILLTYQVLGAVISGGKFQVLLGWQALRTLPPGTDYTFLVRLRDSQGHIWAQADGNGYAPGDWQPGIKGLQLLTIRLPGDLPPRTYHLTVEVVDRRTGQSLPTATGKTAIPLTSLTGRLAETPRHIDLDRLPNPIADIPSANSAQAGKPELVLRGYQIGNRTVPPGDTLSLTLHWQVLKQPRHNDQLEFYLVKDEGDSQAFPSYRWPAVEPIGGEWPTSRWPTDYWVQDRVDLPVGPDVPAGKFKMGVAWVDVNTGQRRPVTFDLDTVIIEVGK